MGNKKIALMAIAVVAIGIFALPSTVSLFSGQHSWYDLNDWSAGHTTVPCEKCHADIAAEMDSNVGPHTELSGSWSGGSFSRLYCEDCHRVFYDYAASEVGSAPVYPKYTYALGAHAASTVECMDCHGVVGDLDSSWNSQHATAGNDYAYLQPCDRCHAGNNFNNVFAAGGFNLTKGKSSFTWNYDPATDDTGERAAHMKFVLDAMDDDLMEGANEACIACHTRIGVNITWTKSEYLEFTAIEDGTGNWTIPGFTAGGTNITYVNSSNEWTNP
jgi:hypothetical protein